MVVVVMVPTRRPREQHVGDVWVRFVILVALGPLVHSTAETTDILLATARVVRRSVAWWLPEIRTADGTPRGRIAARNLGQGRSGVGSQAAEWWLSFRKGRCERACL